MSIFQQKLFISIAAPLLVTIIIGYVSLQNTVSKIAILLEFNEKRIVFIEDYHNKNMEELTSLRSTIVEHTIMLSQILEDHKDIKRTIDLQ